MATRGLLDGVAGEDGREGRTNVLALESRQHVSSASLQRVGAALLAATVLAAIVTTASHGSAVVVLEGAPSNGAGYMANSPEGLASKALLEQSQEAANKGKAELEAASKAHLGMDAALAKLKAVMQAIGKEKAAAQAQSQASLAAQEKASQALLAAKGALSAQALHKAHASDALAKAAAAARKASELADDAHAAHQRFEQEGARAAVAKEGVSRIQASIDATMEELSRLKKQLVAQEDFEPWTPLEDVETNPETSANHAADAHERAPRSTLSDRYAPAQ